MLSTLLEIAGFTAFTIATLLLAGTAAALYVGGVCLLVVGYAVEDDKASLALSRVLAPARKRVHAIRTFRARPVKAG